MNTYSITTSPIGFDIIESIINKKVALQLSDDVTQRIDKCRKYLDDKITAHTEPIYGINTGFGSLYNQSVDAADLEKLQQNLVMSHACGVGEVVPPEVIRLMLFLKIRGLSYGNSGVQVATVKRLIDFYNHDVLPVVYQQGSLGASGDLAPLAHLSLPLLGLGEVTYHSKRMTSEALHKQLNWEPVALRSKEGLALLNGTQFMSSYGTLAVHEAFLLSKWADVVGAISLEAFDGRIEPFHKLIHEVRPHKGQIDVAKRISGLLKASKLISQPKKHVQDPYSFRCIPQVHGATLDTINYASSVFLTEINSVTDNPTIFPDDDLVISAGNFHGQPLALTLDFLSIALSEIGNISERRTYQLISGLRGLPPFLVKNAGLNSGFMIPQYTAASLVSQNKQLCTPASVDSIVSSNGQEDHVSMGANAATKIYRVVENLKHILAIELYTACQALEFRRPLKSSDVLENIFNEYRKIVPFVHEDRIMSDDITLSKKFIENNSSLISSVS